MRGFTHLNCIVYISPVISQAQPARPNFLPDNPFNASPRGVSHTPIKRMVYRRRKPLIPKDLRKRDSFHPPLNESPPCTALPSPKHGMVQMGGLLGSTCDRGV
jgi:hypothetical protein